MTSDRVERRLAAVLAADVVGYSRLMGASEEGTLARLKAVRRDLVDPVIASHRGRIVKTTGDGLLVEFASAVDAVRCAAEVQRDMAAKNADVTQDQRIDFRIGIHVGDIIIDENDIFGDGVNIAARLEGIAEPGGICISDDAQRQVRGKVDFAFDDMGSQSLKNIAEPMRAWRVRLNGDATGQIEKAPLALPDKPSIAVLPFQNMSGDPEQEYFADGMVEDIITALSRFPSLFVIARNSCFTYKGKSVYVRQVGRELGVRYVLEGSVRKAGGRVRITGQLIEAHSNKHLWAEKLDGELTDLFELQDTLTTKIVSSVAAKLNMTEFARVKAKPTVDLDAYELYQRATALQYHEKRFDEAYELYSKAFAIDPSYAAAYVMAASSLFNRQFTLGTPMLPETRAEILRLAQTAIALPREDATAIARAAHFLSHLGKQYDLAKELADSAIALNPNLGFALGSLGWVSVMRGEGQTAVDSFTSLLRLDPLDPARSQAWMGLGCAYNILADYAKGYEWSRKAMELQPAIHTLAYFIINAVPFGRMAEARDATAKMLNLHPDMVVADAMELCHTRDPEWQERMRQSFREVGLSD